MEDKAQYGKAGIEYIRDQKQIMDIQIREAVSVFQANTGVAIRHIVVHFTDVSQLGMNPETRMASIDVTLEDL